MEIGAELDWGADAWNEVRTRAQRAGRAYIWLNPVSYTHLTLPTICSV